MLNENVFIKRKSEMKRFGESVFILFDKSKKLYLGIQFRYFIYLFNIMK